MSAARIARPGESELIARYFAPLAVAPGARRLVDDAASLAPPQNADLVLTLDALVAGVHFFADDDAGAVARKALRVNLSDLAAKGAVPIGYLLGLALEESWSEDWLAAFTAGLAADQDTYGISLYGGDTVSTPGPLTLSITAFGYVPEGRMARRDGAKVGDRIFVTGTIGDAALGLAVRRDDKLAAGLGLADAERAYLLGRYLLPQPRTSLASTLIDHAHGAMDVSDGLIGDLEKMCRASDVSAYVEVDRIPLSPAARTLIAGAPQMLDTALTGGDDYEILATVAPGSSTAFRAGAAAAGISVAEIGVVEAGAGGVKAVLSNGESMRFAHSSYEHF